MGLHEDEERLEQVESLANKNEEIQNINQKMSAIRVVDWLGRAAHGHDGGLVGGSCIHIIHAACVCTHNPHARRHIRINLDGCLFARPYLPISCPQFLSVTLPVLTRVHSGRGPGT